MNNKIDDLRNTNILRLIGDYSIPAIIGMMVMASYNVVDRIFVGRGVGTAALSAIAITFPVNIIIMGFAQLVGMGTTALVSIKLGEGNKDEAERIVGNGVLLGIVISLALSLVLLLFMDPIIVFLGGSTESHQYALQFLSIFLFGIPLQFLSFALNGVIRAQGHPRVALGTMLISGILNMILNPIFIMGLHFGIRGSAVATVIAQAVGAVWVLAYFAGKRSYLRLHRLSFNRAIVNRITSIGISPLIMQIGGSVIMFLFNRGLAQYGGTVAVAAMGIGMSISMFVMMPIFGLNQGIQPIMGYNYGAKLIGRVRETLRKAIFIATAVCTAGFVACMFFPGAIIGVFSAKDPALVAMGARALRLAMLMLPLGGYQVVSWAYFQSVGKPKQAMILTTSKQFLFVIPLVLILPRFYGLDGIWYSMPISDLLAAIVTAVLLLAEVRRLRRMEREVAGEGNAN